jgi:hypothetical protein
MVPVCPENTGRFSLRVRTFHPPPISSSLTPNTHTPPPRPLHRSPIVTGTSVLALTYRDGVLIASDTLGSYGSTKRYKSLERIKKVSAARHTSSQLWRRMCGTQKAVI